MSKMKISKISLVYFLMLADLIYSHDDCSFNDASVTFYDNQGAYMSNFDDFKQLSFKCNQKINISIWNIIPNKKLIIDNTLNLTSLKIEPTERKFAINLINIKGFNLEKNPFENIKFIKYEQRKIIWTLRRGKFDFYLNNILVNDICDWKILKNFKWDFRFNSVAIQLESTTEFSPNTCPFIFKNSYIEILFIHGISSTFIEKNQLQFQNFFDNSINQLNSSIIQIGFKFYRTDFSNKLFNKHVFENTIIVDLDGVITNIENDLFKEFRNIRLFRLRCQNIKPLFVYNNKWINSFNSDLNIDPNKINLVDSLAEKIIIIVIYQMFHNLNLYSYPEEDICYFKDFPHNQLVLPKLRPSFKTNCTCTEIFLIQYSYNYGRSIDYITNKVSTSYYLSQYYTDTFNDNIFSYCLINIKIAMNCKFKQKFKICNITSIKRNKNESYFYVNDWAYLSSNLYAILSKYLNIIFSFLAILFNILVLIIISNKLIMRDYKRMYNYLKICSSLSILHIFVKLFKISNYTSAEQYYYLTMFYKPVKLQYFNLIFIKLFGNILQSASNLALITFTLSRYITISNSKSKFLLLFHKISIIKYLLVIFTFSFIINFHIIFEYSIQTSSPILSQLKSINFSNVINYRQEPFDDYKENFKSTEYIILDIMQYIKIIFSDLFYIILSFIIDLILLFYIKKKMKKKLSMVSFMVNTLNAELIGVKTCKLEKSKTINSLKNRLTLMIVLNGINFTLLRLPLAVLSFYGFIYRYDYEEKVFKPNISSYVICKYFKFCFTLETCFYFVYLNSFIIQFFILFNLDKNFKTGFLDFKLRLKNKFKLR